MATWISGVRDRWRQNVLALRQNATGALGQRPTQHDSEMHGQAAAMKMREAEAAKLSNESTQHIDEYKLQNLRFSDRLKQASSLAHKMLTAADLALETVTIGSSVINLP